MRCATTAATAHTTAAPHTTAANMHTTTATTGTATTAANMPAAASGMTAAATGMAATAAFRGGGVCRGRQRGRKNNGGKSEFELRHNFPRLVRTFAGRSPMFINVSDKTKLH